MKPKQLILISLAALLLTAPLARAGGDDPFDRFDPAPMIGRVLSDDVLGLLFGFMRQSIGAAIEGKTPPELSAESRARLEETGRGLQKEAISGLALVLDGVEKEIRKELREEFAAGR